LDVCYEFVIVNLIMVERKTFEIKNKLGLHARPAAKLVGVSNQYESEIFFERDGCEVDGKSLLDILTMACPRGSTITIRAEGSDAIEAVAALGKVIEDKFGED
jgi:phosphocarrier protein HPr